MKTINNPTLSKKSIEVAQRILSKNDKEALKLRELYNDNGIFTINLMSSPGSGKTTLLENLAKYHLLGDNLLSRP